MSFCLDDSSRTSGNRRAIDKIELKVGEKYNWINQQERLIYLGENFSGNGYWHQFAKVEYPDIVWCKVLYSELAMIEATKAT